MAKISARGAVEVGRWVNLLNGRGYLLRSDGKILRRRDESWALYMKELAPGVDPVKWFKANVVQDPNLREGATPPTYNRLCKWRDSGKGEATDGCQVDHSSRKCEHGYDSWLYLKGFLE